MTPEANPKIIEQLKQFADQGLPYYKAKESLLKNGYSKKDIEIVSYSYSYGQKPAPPDPVRLALEKHPEIAEKIAAGIAQDVASNINDIKKMQTIANGLASEYGPGIHSQVHYTNKFLSNIGMPWWKWIVIEIILAGVIFLLQTWLHLSAIFYNIIVIVLIIALSTKRKRS